MSERRIKSRIALLCALLAALVPGAWCRAQQEFDHSSIMNAPNADPYDLWGPCFRKFLYVSPLQTTYGTVDFVAFRRDWQTSETFATLGNSTDAVLTTGDLQTVYQPGMRVMLGRRVGPCTAVEASFLGLVQANNVGLVQDETINTLGTAGDMFSPFSNFGDPAEVGFDYNYFASIRILSTFNNVELNVRQLLGTPPSCLQASVLFGLRYIDVREQFEYRTDSNEPTTDGTTNYGYVKTRNGMFGAQTGMTVEFRVEERWWLNFESKFMMFYNGAHQNTQFSSGPLAGPGSNVTGSQFGDRVTLGADLAITGIWRFTPRLIGRLGYQGIFLDGLALGSDNFLKNVPVMTTAPNLLDYNGHLAFHGPFIGMTYTW